MEEELVLINKIPLKVQFWGGISPSKLKSGEVKKPKVLLLMLPGNPGVVEFYTLFLTILYQILNIPIWIISHGGHNVVSRNKDVKFPSLHANHDLYNLNGQVNQKIKFINEYLSDVNIILLGHSIGSKMILEVLKNEEISNNVLKCFMFFPTLERMAITKNGKRLLFSLNYIVWLLILGAAFLKMIPVVIKQVLVKLAVVILGYDKNVEKAINCLVDPKVLSQVFFLGKDEMLVVKDLDDDVIEKHKDKLFLYYGASDDWTPLEYYVKLKEKFPGIDAHVSEHNISHAFMLKDDPTDFANFVGQLIKQKIKIL